MKVLVIHCLQCRAEILVYPCEARSGHRKYCSPTCRKSGNWGGKTHGESRTRLHALWCSMKNRCRPGARAASYYADRGIGVCPEWANSFEAFRDWALANGYADGLEIDRIDSDKGYEPGNCRWATRVQQMRNTRKRRDAKTSRFKGVSWCANVGKWRAQIHTDGKPIHIGLYHGEEDAARAYDAKACELFGEFAHPNFKE